MHKSDLCTASPYPSIQFIMTSIELYILFSFLTPLKILLFVQLIITLMLYETCVQTNAWAATQALQYMGIQQRFLSKCELCLSLSTMTQIQNTPTLLVLAIQSENIFLLKYDQCCRHYSTVDLPIPEPGLHYHVLNWHQCTEQMQISFPISILSFALRTKEELLLLTVLCSPYFDHQVEQNYSLISVLAQTRTSQIFFAPFVVRTPAP